jgi:HD-GYP domain-containing protein (c-di-GMP phosphodiesterase class II)
MMISGLRRPQLLLALLGLLVPLATFFYLTDVNATRDRVVSVPVPHFYIVSTAALAAMVLGILVGIASVRTREPRTFFVAAGFLVVAGVFSVHGLTTPGPTMLVHEQHNAILISARLSLFLGGILFCLSAIPLPRRIDATIARNHGALMFALVGLLAIYIGANLAKPDLLDFVPTGTEPSSSTSKGVESPTIPSYSYGYDSVPGSEASAPAAPANNRTREVGRALSDGMSLVTIAFFLFAAWRYFETYEYTRTPATGALAAGLVLLAEAQVIMTLGVVWHLSWWLYHVVMLIGFVIPIAAIGMAYRRGSSLTQIVDGLFVRDAFARVERSFPEAIGVLIAAIEKKDPYLRGHMRRVGELTADIADELDLPDETARTASHAALLHDIGKLGLPSAILHKPGRLTDEEFEILKVHPERGYEMVMQAPALVAAAPAIRWHHERLDGTGYPDRIDKSRIPIEARIVAVADVWDALTSDRVYRRAMNDATAREIMRGEAGAKLDEECVRALFAVLDREADQPHAVTRTMPRHVERPLPTFLAS